MAPGSPRLRRSTPARPTAAQSDPRLAAGTRMAALAARLSGALAFPQLPLACLRGVRSEVSAVRRVYASSRWGGGRSDGPDPHCVRCSNYPLQEDRSRGLTPMDYSWYPASMATWLARSLAS